MITRRKLLATVAVGGAGMSVVPASWWQAGAATKDSNDPGFDLRGVNTRYTSQGAPFSPFLMKFARQDALQNLWDSERGNTQMSAWRVRGHTSGNKRFLPLGDAASINGRGSQSVTAMLLAPGDDPTALANPVRFEYRSNDHGSGNPRDLAYFQPIPPPGYTALGTVFNPENNPVNNYWCVRNDVLRVLNQNATVWNDSGSKFKDNGDLYRGVLSNADIAVGSQMFILPNTLIGAQTSVPKAALITRKLTVEGLKWTPPGVPPFDADSTEGDKFSPGIARVMVLPCSAVSDPSLQNQANVSPFYYVVNRHVWVCTATDATPEGGERSYSYTIGTSETDSSEFRQSTSWNVSSSVGFQAGGAGANVSVSFTQDFALTTAHSATSTTSKEEKTMIRLPRQPVTQFWQLFSRISMYRGDGSLVSTLEYGKKDLRLLPAGNASQ